MMSRPNIFVLLTTLASLMLRCSEESSCQRACSHGFDCLLEHYETTGTKVDGVREQESQFLRACTATCGGQYEPANPDGDWAASASCAELIAVPTLVRGDSVSNETNDNPLRSAIRQGIGAAVVPDATCQALALDPSYCDRLEPGDAQDDCRLGAAVRFSIGNASTTACQDLVPRHRDFCLAVTDRSVQCRSLGQPFRTICRQFAANNPTSDPAHMLMALAENNPAHCLQVEDEADRRGCQAAMAKDDSLCPRRLKLFPELMSQLGSGFRRVRSAPAAAAPPWFLPQLYHLLAVLAILFWVGLPLWVCRTVLRNLRLARWPLLVTLAGCTVAFIVSRFVAPPGPINFVEYERVFAPGHGDLGRLAYAGQALLLHPVMSLFGPSFGLVFIVNSLFVLLAALGCFSISRRLSGDGWVAMLAALLVALCPAAIRLGATASETAGFCFLVVLLFDLLAESLSGDFRCTLAALVLAPLVACYRPEGVFLAIPVGIMAVSLGAKGRVRIIGPGGTAAVLVGFGVLFSSLVPPHIPPGLFLTNAQEFLGETINPRFFTALLMASPVGHLALVAAGRRRWWAGRFEPVLMQGLFVPALAFVLLALWCVQGSELNLAFGSTRYLVIALPWLAISAGILVGALRPRCPRWALGIGIAMFVSLLPSSPLVFKETNMQQEFVFLQQVADALPANGLLVVPTAIGPNQEFSPENPVLGVLSMRNVEFHWKSLAEVVSPHPHAATTKVEFPADGFFLYQGFFRDAGRLDRLAESCIITTVLEVLRLSVPDVAYYKAYPAGEPVSLNLYRVECD